MLVESFNRTRWLDKLRPAGASQKGDGPEGPLALIVTTNILKVEKNFSRVILVLWAMLIFQYRSTEIHNLCVSSLRQSHAIFTISWSRNFRHCRIEKKHARSFHQYLHSRIMRVILAQGSCQVLRSLDVSSKKGAMPLFFHKKKYVRVILAQRAMQIFSAQKTNKQRATDSM